MKIKHALRKFWKEEDGIGTLEIVLIIAVIVLLALIFKKWIIALVNSLLGTAETKAKTIFSD